MCTCIHEKQHGNGHGGQCCHGRRDDIHLYRCVLVYMNNNMGMAMVVNVAMGGEMITNCIDVYLYNILGSKL